MADHNGLVKEIAQLSTANNYFEALTSFDTYNSGTFICFPLCFYNYFGKSMYCLVILIIL